MKYSVVFYQTLVILLASRLRDTQADCFVPMNGGLPNPEPLVLVPAGSHDGFGFKLPSAGSTLVFAEGEEARLVCTGPNNLFWFLPPQHDIIVTCDNGMFNYGNIYEHFDFFNCSENSISATRPIPTLCNNGQDHVIEIGFDVSMNEFYSIMEICFDENNLNSIWSKFDLVSAIRDGEVGLSRPFFQPGPYYDGMNPDILYTRNTQRNTIGTIIGMSEAYQYIPHFPQDSRHYLARGHLTASADFVYNVQKSSTYYFLNAAPQWHSFNDGTWRDLENSVRFYAHSKEVDLVVFTGTHGVATLPDPDGTEHELYLDFDPSTNIRRIAVPLLFWKVVYNPESKKGIAFVGVNDPYINIYDVSSDPDYHLCETKINVPYWEICRSFEPAFQEQGFGYCCEVNDFRNFVTSLPRFTVTGSLG